MMMGLSFTLVLLLLLLQLSSSSGLRSIREDGYGDHQHHHHHPIGKLSEQSPVAASIIQGQCRNPLFFVFGASMVDVGESTAMKPYSQGCNFPPYGLDYFPEPAGRWSNGRLIIDFITQTLGYGFINPYLQSFNSNLTCGASFAVSGSRAIDNGLTSFPFPTQLRQFKYLLSQAMINETSNQDIGYTQQQIAEAIYFLDVADNDYLSLIEESLDFDVSTAVSEVISSMKESLEVLYGLGARKILVMSLTPFGCTPHYMTRYSSLENDEYGCKNVVNSICELHNQQTETLLYNLTMEFSDAKWIFFDAYSIYFDGIINPEKYGIQYPFKACCGAGGEYNVVPDVGCGSSGYVNGTFVISERCSDPTLYLMWDPIHPTESFARYVAEGVTSGSHLRPEFNIKGECIMSM